MGFIRLASVNAPCHFRNQSTPDSSLASPRLATMPPGKYGQSASALRGVVQTSICGSDVNLFSYRQGFVDLDAK
jgi:hypothetical protein